MGKATADQDLDGTTTGTVVTVAAIQGNATLSYIPKGAGAPVVPDPIYNGTNPVLQGKDAHFLLPTCAYKVATTGVAVTGRGNHG